MVEGADEGTLRTLILWRKGCVSLSQLTPVTEMIESDDQTREN